MSTLLGQISAVTTVVGVDYDCPLHTGIIHVHQQRLEHYCRITNSDNKYVAESRDL